MTNGGSSAGRLPGKTDFACMSTSPTNATPTLASGAAATVGGIDFVGAGSVKPDLTVAGTLTLGDSSLTVASSLDQLQLTGTLISGKGEPATATTVDVQGTVEGPGTLTVTGSATFDGGSLGSDASGASPAHVILTGTGTVTDDDLFLYDGSELENQGTLSLQNSASLNDEDGNSANLVLNDTAGTISFTGSSSSQSAAVNNNTTNDGTLVAGKGTLNVPTLTNLSGSGTLTGGTYDASGGSLDLPGNVIVNAATIELGAAPSEIGSGSTNELTSLKSSSGTLQLGSSLTLGQAFANSGTVSVQAGTFAASSFSQSAGTTTVVGGATLKSGGGSGAVTINGGTLTGTGAVDGNLSGKGDVNPSGTVAGPMSLAGTYTASGGTLTIPVNGTATAGVSYGQLSATKAATLSGGTLTFATASATCHRSARFTRSSPPPRSRAPSRR